MPPSRRSLHLSVHREKPEDLKAQPKACQRLREPFALRELSKMSCVSLEGPGPPFLSV